MKKVELVLALFLSLGWTSTLLAEFPDCPEGKTAPDEIEVITAYGLGSDVNESTAREEAKEDRDDEANYWLNVRKTQCEQYTGAVFINGEREYDNPEVTCNLYSGTYYCNAFSGQEWRCCM